MAAALAENTSLQSVVFWRCGISDNGAHSLAVSLALNRHLEMLDLCNNKIGDRGAETLAKSLEINVKLQRLNLAVNMIGDKGAQALAKTLQTNSTLRYLHVWNNQISAKGEQALIKALERNTTLQGVLIADIENSDIFVAGLLGRNRDLEKFCDGRNLKRTKKVALAMRLLQIPIYILLEIVEWEWALQMAEIELRHAGKRCIALKRHQRRCELLNRSERAKMIEFIYKKKPT